MDIRSAEHDEWPVGGLLLRHDRPQDRGAHRRLGRRRARCWPRTMRAIIDAYRGFGWALGLAFQLNDDLLGIWGDEAVTGKEPSDIAERKKTLPLIHALEQGIRGRPARGCARSCAARRPTRPRVDGGARRSWSAPARASTRASAPAPTGTRRIAQLEAAGVVDGEAMERLRAIVELGDPRLTRSRGRAGDAPRSARRLVRPAARPRRPRAGRAHGEHLAHPPAVGRLDGERRAVHLDRVAHLGHAADPW